MDTKNVWLVKSIWLLTVLLTLQHKYHANKRQQKSFSFILPMNWNLWYFILFRLFFYDFMFCAWDVLWLLLLLKSSQVHTIISYWCTRLRRVIWICILLFQKVNWDLCYSIVLRFMKICMNFRFKAIFSDIKNKAAAPATTIFRIFRWKLN